MSNPFHKGNPDPTFRTWQREQVGYPEDSDADARRYNRNINVPYHDMPEKQWIDNRAQYEGGDGFYKRMISGNYQYKIYFNTSDTTETTNGQWPINGRSRQQVINLIQQAFDEINVLGIGENNWLQYFFDGDEDDDKSIPTPNGDTWGIKNPDTAPYLRGSILCNFQNRDGSVGASTGSKFNWFTITLSIGDSFCRDDEKFKYALKHEFLHNLGLNHEFPQYTTEHRKENRDGITYSFYNEQINFSKLAPKYRTLSIHKDTLSWLDVQYNTPNILQSSKGIGWNWKIYGQIDNLPYNYNKEFMFESGHCEVLLINLKTMEYEYRTPIDYTGYFEFRLRIPTEELVNYGIMCVSSHFYHKRMIEYEGTMHDEFQPGNFWKESKENWYEGYLYYFFDNKQIAWVANNTLLKGKTKGLATIPPTDANVWSFKYEAFNENNGKIALIYMSSNKRAKSLKELENQTGVRNIYAYFMDDIKSISIKKAGKMLQVKKKQMLRNDFKCSSQPTKYQ